MINIKEEHILIKHYGTHYALEFGSYEINLAYYGCGTPLMWLVSLEGLNEKFMYQVFTVNLKDKYLPNTF